jgi:hypothetical protein
VLQAVEWNLSRAMDILQSSAPVPGTPMESEQLPLAPASAPESEELSDELSEELSEELELAPNDSGSETEMEDEESPPQPSPRGRATA